MVKIFKLITKGFQAIVISEEWSYYKEDDTGKVKRVSTNESNLRREILFKNC